MFRQSLVLLLLGWTSCHALLLQSPLLRGRGGSFFRNGAGRRIVPSAVPLADFPHKLSVPSSLYSAPTLLQNKTTDALLPAVLHESDVERLSELLCECLGGGEVRLPNEGFADWERRLLAPPLDAWNSFARSANRYETSLGIRVRCKDRLRFDNVRIRERSGASEKQKKVEDEEEGGEGQGAGETAVSLLDAVGKVDGSLDIAYEPDFDLRDRQSLVLVLEDDERRIVASAELALQPRDGQLPTNFPSLFGFSEDTATGAALAGAGSQGRSDVRRKEKEEEEEEEEEEEGRARYSHYYYPYICNVAVAPRWRRSGLAKRLVRLCEQLAARQWGYAEIYLHVDPSNAAATRLYERAGYVPVPPQERAGPAAILGGLFEVMEPNVTYMWKKL